MLGRRAIARFEAPEAQFIPAGRRAVVRKPSGLVLFAFSLFVASIPFEAMELGLGTISPSRLAGWMFFAVAFLQPGICFRKPPVAFWCFFAFYVVFFLNGYLRGNLSQAGALTLFQTLVLLWLASNLLRYPPVFLRTLNWFVASCVLLSLLQLAGKTTVMVAGRESTGDADPNTVGAVFALGLVAVVCIGYGRRSASRFAKLAPWFCLVIIGLGLVRTGSRGASVELAVGILVLIMQRGSASVRLRNLVVVAIGLTVLLTMLLSSEVAHRRWEVAIEKRTMAGRERIFPQAWRMFLEKPILGWGPGVNVTELGWRTGTERRDTHNLYLWVLSEDGVAGAIPYFVGLWLCFRAAWRSRSLVYGLVPLALLSTVLVTNMSLTWQYRKTQWFVLALALASESPLMERRRPRHVPGIPGTDLRPQKIVRQRTPMAAAGSLRSL